MKAGVETGWADGKAWAGGKGRERGNGDGERPTGVGLREQGTRAQAGVEAYSGSGIIKVAEGSALKTEKLNKIQPKICKTRKPSEMMLSGTWWDPWGCSMQSQDLDLMILVDHPLPT